MSQQCPRCRKTLDVAGAQLSFCGYCGAALNASTVAFDPDATLAPQTNTEFMTGPERLGEYRLVRCLGRGGMGVVHEGVHEATGRRVAVKLIDVAASPEALTRFRREGKLAASVTHPRCVFVLAVDEAGGRPYIVMELMPGKTLDDLVRANGPLSPGRAIDLTLDLIEGLEQIHALGIIHRDVKPSNCFLDEQGRLKVGDFGLARSLTFDARLTKTGTFVGTPLFAAPEQILGQALDVRADVYSVCATLWFLLAGRAPHDTGDGDVMAILARVVSDDPPPLRSLCPDVPAGLARLLARGLARDRAPQGAPGMHGWAPDIIQAIGEPTTDAEGFLHGFFTDSAASRAAGAEFLGRIYSRTQGRDKDTTWQTRNAQYDAVLKWGTPNYGLLQRLNTITQPVFIANGDNDRMILPWYSHLVASLIPGAFVKLYPDAAHGFLFQHAEEFAGDVLKFLDS